MGFNPVRDGGSLPPNRGGFREVVAAGVGVVATAAAGEGQAEEKVEGGVSHGIATFTI